jgi:hypothetical protein
MDPQAVLDECVPRHVLWRANGTLTGSLDSHILNRLLHRRCEGCSSDRTRPAMVGEQLQGHMDLRSRAGRESELS